MTTAFDRGRMADVSLSVLQAADTEGVPLWQSLAEDGILSEKKFLEFFQNN